MSLELLATVFAGSLLGSLHCVGMCGGFVAFYAGSWGPGAGRRPLLPHVAYNLGRLSTYLLLGAVAGALGAAVNLAGSASGLQQAAAVVSGVLILLWGGALLLQATTRLRLPTPRWLDDLLGKVLPSLRAKPPVVRGLILGMSSTLLPCGWLYGFAVTAAGTGTALGGAALMGAFWLGTVPALVGTGLGIQKVARWVGPKLPVLMPAMLLVLGLVTITQRGLVPTWAQPKPPTAGVKSAGQHEQP
ncbi:MAG: sulfite exporter TauE/SafE family protein [Deltaproteobacteria bacterium]|nr:sulfite exporter TauE/SafE family protein [Deltaproteobacteria bacterium]